MIELICTTGFTIRYKGAVNICFDDGYIHVTSDAVELMCELDMGYNCKTWDAFYNNDVESITGLPDVEEQKGLSSLSQTTHEG